MKSKPRRNTSNSGSSVKSTNKATSRRSATSSPTAPASFEQVFGAGEPPGLADLRSSLLAAQQALALHRASPVMPTAPKLFKTRWRVKETRIERQIRDLQEAITHVTG